MTETKWTTELIRIAITVVTIVVTVVWFGAKLDKQIALNEQAIRGNTAVITKIMENHLPHIQEIVNENREMLIQIKAILK